MWIYNTWHLSICIYLSSPIYHLSIFCLCVHTIYNENRFVQVQRLRFFIVFSQKSEDDKCPLDYSRVWEHLIMISTITKQWDPTDEDIAHVYYRAESQTGGVMKTFSFMTSFYSAGRYYTGCCSWEKTSMISPSSEQWIIQYQSAWQNVNIGSKEAWRLLGQPRTFWLDLEPTHRIHASYFKTEAYSSEGQWSYRKMN